MKIIMISLILSMLCPPYTKQTPLHIWLIFGQSNATGAEPAPAAQVTNLRVLMLTKSGAWALAREPSNLLYADVGGGYSLGSAFARVMAYNYGIDRIGIINCSIGGTQITQWRAGNPIYDNCIAYAKNQTAGIIEGVIFVQGEADTMDYASASSWRNNFEIFASSIRANFGNIPIILPVLGAYPSAFEPTKFPYWDVVRDNQFLAGSTIPLIFPVETIGIPKWWDTLHYGIIGANILGVRAANIYSSIVGAYSGYK